MKPSAENGQRKELYDAEIRAKMYEQMKHRAFMRKLLKNVFEVAILLGTLASAGYLYKMWDSHLEHKRVLAEEARAAEDARRAEELRLREEAKAAETARREAEMERARAEREKAAQEKKLVQQERESVREAYKIFTYALRENEFDMFGKSVTNNLEGSGAELCYLLPADGKELPLYWVRFPSGGAPDVRKISASGDSVPMEYGLFAARLANLSYLVAKDGKVYFRSTRRKPLWGRLGKAKGGNPADAFFAGLGETVSLLNPEYDDLVFDIVFADKKSGKQIVCESLEFGCEYSPENVRAAVEKAYPPKNLGFYSIGEEKRSPFKRTVKIYNGSMIMRGLGDITYVPRHPPTSRTTRVSYGNLPGWSTVHRARTVSESDAARWSSLYQQALREEAEEKAYYENRRKEREAKINSRIAQAERSYGERIDRILDEGELMFHAKRKK